MALLAQEERSVVVNLASQSGVSYSLENPAAYIQSNLVGFGHLPEGCRHHGTAKTSFMPLVVRCVAGTIICLSMSNSW